jgi:hypothetical protein
MLLKGAPSPVPGMPGVEVSQKDIIDMQEVEIRALRDELSKLRVQANTLANTTACLAALAEPDHEGWVTVPREMRQRFKDDVKLSIRRVGEGTQIRWVTRPNDHVFEGRTDG